MRLELIGINKEDIYDSPNGGRGAVPIPEGPLRQVVVATLAERNRDGYYSTLRVPAEMVRGAEVGDEFTVYLERVKK